MIGFQAASGVSESLWTRSASVRASVEVESRRDAVQSLERERDLQQIRVARPLPHPVDRPVDPRCPRLHRRDRRRGREAEVVVPVPVDGNVAADPVPDLADEKRRRLGRRDPQRVDDDDFGRARLHRRLVSLPQEADLGAARVHAEVRDADALLDGIRDRAADPLEHRLPGDPERRELGIRDGALDHRSLETELDERFDIRPDCT